MKLNNQLSENIFLFGPKETSIFTDQNGHQGDIVRETAGLPWTTGIFNIDLNTLIYETSFDTNLREIAVNIHENNDPNYKH